MNLLAPFSYVNHTLKALVVFLCLCTALQGEEKKKKEFRDYESTVPARVKEFYKNNHTKQTYAFAQEKQSYYSQLNHGKMSIWEAMELLDQIVDESDPDLDLPQSYHAYQTAEAMRKDEQPRWMILTGFIHDLGKILSHYGEEQWAVVGDTFPLGCSFSSKIIFHEYFSNNPDKEIPEYQSPLGIYEKHCGFDQVQMSWGHDEYLYQVLKDKLPPEASYIIRYHSFYAAHKEGAYAYFMNAYDEKMMKWLKVFQQYDLYSKSEKPIDIAQLKPFYKDLVEEFLPQSLSW